MQEIKINQGQDKNQTQDRTVSKYIENVGRSSKKTAADYRKRLSIFRDFVTKNYNISLDELIRTLTTYSHGPKIDVYDLLSDYVSYVIRERNVSALTLKLLVSTIRSYLETFDVEISPRKFRLKVIMPRVIRSDKEPLEKNDIQKILNACHNLKLKTYVLFLAATGCRAKEGVSVRLCDFNLENNPATVFIRGAFTKTKTDRTIMLTDELVQQLKLWINYKYRTRMVSHFDKNRNKTYTEKRTPKVNKEILLFSNRYEVDPSVDGLYNDMLLMFENTLDRLGDKYAELEYSKKRRKFTLHSLRRWAKTTISNLGYESYSEYYLGHKGSDYYKTPVSEKIKLFRTIEPYVTFLDQTALERKGADLQSRLEVMEKENYELRSEFQKVHDVYNETTEDKQQKDDALATLSDQVMKLMAEVQELKKNKS